MSQLVAKVPELPSSLLLFTNFHLLLLLLLFFPFFLVRKIGGPWTGSMGWSMDRVHRGGPWTRVHVLYTSVSPVFMSFNRSNKQNFYVGNIPFFYKFLNQNFLSYDLQFNSELDL